MTMPRAMGLASVLVLAAALASAQTDRVRYVGWRATDMIETPVETPSGDQLGNVENLILNGDGSLDRIVVESPGFLDMGDREFAAPWSSILVAPRMERVFLTDPRVAEGSAGVRPGSDEHRLRDLLDWPVVLRDGATFGEVHDLIFRADGGPPVVVVARPGGYVALLWARFAVRRRTGELVLALSADEATALDPFDYAALVNVFGG